MTRFILKQTFVFWAVLLVLAHLYPVKAAETSEDRLTEIPFNRMAVAPILVGHRQPNMNEALDRTLSCPIDEICLDDPAIEPDAGSRMMRMIHAALERRFGRHMVNPEQVQAAYADIRLDGSRDTPGDLVSRLGDSLSADLVMVVTLWRYRARSLADGFPERPASVAFALYLVEPKSGRRLWRGIYDASQEYATDDMARFKQRIKMGLSWLSVDDLARHGIKEALGDLPPKVRPVNQP